MAALTMDKTGRCNGCCIMFPKTKLSTNVIIVWDAIIVVLRSAKIKTPSTRQFAENVTFNNRINVKFHFPVRNFHCYVMMMMMKMITLYIQDFPLPQDSLRKM